jgi:hypothetical protein
MVRTVLTSSHADLIKWSICPAFLRKVLHKIPLHNAGKLPKRYSLNQESIVKKSYSESIRALEIIAIPAKITGDYATTKDKLIQLVDLAKNEIED